MVNQLANLVNQISILVAKIVFYFAPYLADYSCWLLGHVSLKFSDFTRKVDFRPEHGRLIYLYIFVKWNFSKLGGYFYEQRVCHFCSRLWQMGVQYHYMWAHSWEKYSFKKFWIFFPVNLIIDRSGRIVKT